jgi:hypothetical protein
MKVPFKTLASFGVNKGYASDAAYLVDYPSPSDGDMYYNITDHSYHHYDSATSTFTSGSGTAIGAAVSGATPYQLLYTDGNGNLGNSPSFAVSEDYARLLLGASTDDGVSDLVLNGNATFEAGVITSLPQPSTTTVLFNEKVVLGAYGPTGAVTILFTSGVNSGFSTTATGYAFPGGAVATTVYVLDNTPPNTPTQISGETFSVNGSGSYNIGEDDNGNWYYPFPASAQPASWTNGSNNAYWINGSLVGSAVGIIFGAVGSSYVVLIAVARGNSPYPAGTSTTLSAVAINSVDPVNRLLIANDGLSLNLNWSLPGQVLINNPTPDGVSALQVYGQTSLGGNLIFSSDATYSLGTQTSGRPYTVFVSDYINVGSSTMMTDFNGVETYLDGLSTFGDNSDVVTVIGSWSTATADPNPPSGFIGFHTRTGALYEFGGATGFYLNPAGGNRDIKLRVFTNPSATDLINFGADGSLSFFAENPNPYLLWSDGTGSIGQAGTNRPLSAYIQQNLYLGDSTAPYQGNIYFPFSTIMGPGSGSYGLTIEVTGGYAFNVAASYNNFTGDNVDFSGYLSFTGYGNIGEEYGTSLTEQPTKVYIGSQVLIGNPNGVNVSSINPYVTAALALYGSNTNIVWDTDGSGNIGASGANRPGNLFLSANAYVAGRTLLAGVTDDTVSALQVKGRISVPPVTLTDGATVTLNAALGSTFYLTSTSNPTLAAPTNPVDGQKILIEFTASGSNQTLTLASGAGGFTFGSDIPGPLTQTTAGDTDIIGCVYNAALNTWFVVAYARGF